MKFSTIQYVFYVACTTIFAYLLFSALMVLWFAGYDARIDYFNFLVPHASKVALWSGVSLFWLRTRFGWRYPFAMLTLYASAELFTNAVYFIVHGWYFPTTKDFQIFLLAQTFFVFCITLSYNFIRGHFELKRDWAMLPFIIFVGGWASIGYVTESTAAVASPMLESFEFIWNALYLLMAVNIFRTRQALR